MKVMKTFVKLKCENKEKAIRALERLASGKDEVCIYNLFMQEYLPSMYESGIVNQTDLSSWSSDYFESVDEVDVNDERCSTIVSRSGKELGDNDFMFEWIDKPNRAQISQLETEIRELLEPTGCEATIKTE